MKKRVICLLALFGLSICWFWPIHKLPPASVSQPNSASHAVSQFPSAASSQASVVPANQASTSTSMQVTHDAEVKKDQTEWAALLMTPITFYGKVVDEKGHPISGAKADLSAADHPMGAGSKYERITDENGLFSITGIHGLGMVAQVSKEGYYTLPQSRGNFGYATGAGESAPHRDPNNPAIFVLRKRGETEPLIAQKFHTEIPKNGTPVRFNLKNGKLDTEESIQISILAADGRPLNSNQPFDWRCEISVPNGALVLRSGEFDFEAPTDGYQSQDVIDMPPTRNWRDQASREYFLKLSDGQYARVSVTIFAGGNYQFVNMTSYLNPSGSRNLEYDPAKAIKP